VDDFKDILLEGEQVVWSGRPDPAFYKATRPFWKHKLVHFAWLLLIAAIFLVLSEIDSRLRNSGLVGDVVGIFAILVAIGFAFTLATFFNFKDHRTPPQYDSYTITDRRLIVSNAKTKATHSVFPRSVYRITNNAGHKHITLSVHVLGGYEQVLVLHGLRDASEVEKMIAQRFSVSESKSS